jgi:hypothetical protein
MYGYFTHELIHLPALAHLVFFLFPTAFVVPQRGPTSPVHFPPFPVTRLSPRLRYYTAVRLLRERRSPLRFRL